MENNLLTQHIIDLVKTLMSRLEKLFKQQTQI